MGFIEGIMTTGLEVLKGLNSLGLAGRIGYVCGLGLWTLLCLPTTPVELAAGVSFPLLSCCAMSAAGKTVGSLVALLLGRRLLRPFIARYLADRGGGGALHSSVVIASRSQLVSLACGDRDPRSQQSAPWLRPDRAARWRTALLDFHEGLRRPRERTPTLAFLHTPQTQAQPPASRAARAPDPDDEPTAGRAAAHPSEDLRPLPLPRRAHPAHVLRRHRHHLQPAARSARSRRGDRAGPPCGSRACTLWACTGTAAPPALRRPGPQGSKAKPRPARPPQCRPVAPASRRRGHRSGSHGSRAPPTEWVSVCRWSLVWTLASSSASSLADAKNSSTAVTAGKISLLLVLLGLGAQLSRFAHTQLQAPALTRAPQIPVRYTLGACALGARAVRGRCPARARQVIHCTRTAHARPRCRLSTAHSRPRCLPSSRCAARRCLPPPCRQPRRRRPPPWAP